MVFDKVGLVNQPRTFRPQPILQRGERTDPTGKFNQRPPQEGRHVEPRQALPLEYQEPSQNDEKNKGEVGQ